jgi:hypothetical protein
MSFTDKTFYHATSGKNVPRILEEGLLPRGRVGRENGIHKHYIVDPDVIYLWGTLDRAAVYGLQCEDMHILEVKGIHPLALAPGDEFCTYFSLGLGGDILHLRDPEAFKLIMEVSDFLASRYGSTEIDKIASLAPSDSLNSVMQTLRVLPASLRTRLAEDCDKKGNPVEHFGLIGPEHLRSVSACEVIDRVASVYSSEEWRMNTNLLDAVLEEMHPRLLVSA